MSAAHTDIAELRPAAQDLAARLPPLLAEAQRLAASVVMGSHGRRQAGAGEEFWQFRPALPGDEWRRIDWRRSARSDAHFIRQQEWQAAQSVLFWIDGAQSMRFTGARGRDSKGARAALLGLAAMILLLRGGERVGLFEDSEPPRSGETQIDRICAQIASRDEGEDYGLPAERVFARHSRAVFLSDFLGDPERLDSVLSNAAARGVSGALVHLLDPMEESFPYDGRTEFRSMAGALRFETLRARGLRDDYLERLAALKARLQGAAERAGWRYLCHHTDQPAQPALMWLYQTLEAGR